MKQASMKNIEVVVCVTFPSASVVDNHVLYALVFCFFFFQAEDGIRDVAVTGVQTCALPIFHRSLGVGAALLPPRARPGAGRRPPERARGGSSAAPTPRDR